MKFLVIIPTHNEEDNILHCLDSLQHQTFQDFVCVVVNDGSTDQTPLKVEHFINHVESSQFSIIHLTPSVHQPGAKVVRTFNKGLENQNVEDFDIICKFDADIVFPKNYLEKVHDVYKKNPDAGMVSGLVYVHNENQKNNVATLPLYDFTDSNEWIFENLSSRNHVRGPIKSYRKELFLKMNGLRAVLGWDNIDVMLCKMHGYETITLKDLWVKHLRPTAYKYKSKKAQKLGEYFYNIGLNFPLAAISSAKSSFKNKSISEFLITMKSFLKQNQTSVLTQEEIAFIRKLRWHEMFKKFKSI